MVRISPLPFGGPETGPATALADAGRRLAAALHLCRQPTIRAARVEFVLPPDHPLRIEGARGRVVQCIAGRVWITAHGLSEDVFLAPGECWRVAGNDRVLAEGVGGEAKVRIG